MLLAPDPLQRRVQYFERHPFIETTSAMTFVDGTVVGTDVNKPSEFLAGIDLPLDIIEHILSIPFKAVGSIIPSSKAPAGGTGDQ